MADIQPQETDLLTFLDRLDTESTSVKEALGVGDTAALEQFRGHQWPDRSRSPMFLANIIGATIDRKAALLSEAKPTIRILPRRQGLDATATILQKTIHAGWDEYGLTQALEDLAYLQLIDGAGFIGLTWDPMADFGTGDIVPTVKNVRQVRLDPAVARSQDLHRAQYVVIDDIVPLWTLWRRFPGRGALVKPDAVLSKIPDRGSPRGQVAWAANQISRVYQPEGVPLEQGPIPRARVRDYWFHDPTLNADGALRYPAGRHITRGGSDVILLDEPNPYWDGSFPLEMLDGRPDPDHPWGRSETEGLRRLQEAINRMGHAFVENAILTGNTWVTTQSEALTPTTINKLNNLGAIVIETRPGRTVERQPPPPMPPHFMDFIRLAMQLMEVLTGLHDGHLEGRGRIELRSGEQLDGLQQAAQTLIRAMARRVEGLLERLGQKWIARIFQFYTSDRLLTYLGPGADYQSFTFERAQLLGELIAKAQREIQAKAAIDGSQMTDAVVSETVQRTIRSAFRDFRFKVTPGSGMAGSKVQRALAMHKLAASQMVSRKKVLEELGFANPEQEIEEAMREAEVLGPVMPQKGG